MKIQTYKHDDDRRLLVEYIHDMPIRNSKVLFIKKDSVLGNHYHKLKNDVFFLLKGSGTYTFDGLTNDFKEGDCLSVTVGVRHSFNLKAGSILLEASSLPYVKGDEYEI